MFEAAVSKFVKSVGKESLLPVPSLDEANRCRPLQVVIKKNRRWLWQSAKYETTPFMLNQLLTDEKPFTEDEAKTTKRTLTNYNKTYAFRVNGKLGGSLKALLEVELDGSDSVNVEAKFGEITKVELDEPSLMNAVEARSLAFNHEFVELVRSNPRKVFCVVVGSAMLAKEGSVHTHVIVKGEEKVDVPKVVVGKEDEDAEVSDDSDKTMTVPANTPVAYSVRELWVNADGKLQLITEPESRGGFSTDSVDGSLDDTLDIDNSMETQYSSLLAMCTEDRQALTNNVLKLCAAPMDVKTMLCLLKHGLEAAPTGEPKTEKLPAFNDPEAAKFVLELATFKVKDDGTVTNPTEKAASLSSLLTLFEALMELDDDEIFALQYVNANYAPALRHLLSSLLDDTPVKMSDKELQTLFADSNPGQAFTQTLGIQVIDNGTLIMSEDNMAELEGAYRAVYALWWDSEEANKAGRLCTLL